MKTRFPAIEPLVFYALLLAWLLPLWTVDFLVTGDGPCHLYNSKILLDFLRGTNRDFYEPYYFLNANFDPNWFSNLAMMGLLTVFSPTVSEKLFLTAYLLGFALGMRALVRAINPASVFLSSLGLLFGWHRLLMLGFFNNTCSLALWFLAVVAWLRIREQPSPLRWFGLGLLFLALYSAHPMGFTFGGMMCGAFLVGWLLLEWRQDGLRTAAGRFWERGFRLGLAALPALVLFAEFMIRRDWSVGQKPDFQGIWDGISNLHPLVTMDNSERGLARAVAVFCGLTAAVALVQRLRERKLKAMDGAVLFFAFTLWASLRPPSGISGGLDVPVRVAMMPFLGLIFAAATADFPRWFRFLTMAFSAAMVAWFLAVRLPIHQKASDLAEEIATCNPHLPERTRLFVLNYDWAGQTPDGQRIADRTWLFSHVDCYLGAYRSAAISDNYEVNFWYFPLIERGQTNFYQKTERDGKNFDHRPPRANILDYRRRSDGQEIDFVLMVSYRAAEFGEHEYTKEIFGQLSQAYEEVHRSAHGRAVLYRRKTGGE